MTENQKTVQDYRRNIYLLKTRIAEEEENLNRLKEEYSPYNLLEDESEQFKMKSKILEGLYGNSISVLVEAALSVKKDGKGTIPNDSWQFLLECFMIKKEPKLSNRRPPHEDAYDKMIELFRSRKILPDGLWSDERIDLAQFMFGLLEQAKEISVLEAVSIYFRFNPERQPFLDRRQLVFRIKQRMNERGGVERPRLKGL